VRRIPVFIGYDVEDVIHPESDDALKRLAEIHNDLGLRATFYMVGEKARRLRTRGRRDALDALKGHEIGYHGNYWFEFPHTAILYCERLPWDEAVQRAREAEFPGLNDVAEITGQWPAAWVQHQGNWGPALAHVLREAGLTAWNGWGHPGGPKFIMDTFAAVRGDTNASMQGSWMGVPRDPVSPRQKPPCNPEEDFLCFQKKFEDRMKGGKATHISVVSHPTCWVTSEWWGWYELSEIVSRNGVTGTGIFPSLRQFQRVPMRSPEDSEGAFKFARMALEWLSKRNDIDIVPIGEYGRRVEGPRGQWISHDVLAEAARVTEAGPDVFVKGAISLSPADILAILAEALAFAFDQGRFPEQYQVKRILGPVEEPLPPSPTTDMNRTAIWDVARSLSEQINRNGRLPTYGKSHATVYSLGQCAVGLARAYLAVRNDGKTPDAVPVGDAPALPKGGSDPSFDKLPLGLNGAAEPLLKEQMHKQMRWQSWSVRPGIETD
jgi:hypothetical protein